MRRRCHHFARTPGPQDRPRTAALSGEGDAEHFNRVLALWLDLQNAIQPHSQHLNRQRGCTPWACPDPRVRAAWEKLTDPRNAATIEQLLCLLGEGPQLGLVEQALRACREMNQKH